MVSSLRDQAERVLPPRPVASAEGGPAEAGVVVVHRSGAPPLRFRGGLAQRHVGRAPGTGVPVCEVCLWRRNAGGWVVSVQLALGEGVFRDARAAADLREAAGFLEALDPFPASPAEPAGARRRATPEAILGRLAARCDGLAVRREYELAVGEALSDWAGMATGAQA